MVTRDQVPHAKPDPDLFLAASERLAVDITRCIVVGDSVWDLLAAQRARALGVGLLSGGYGEDELARAGAYRVYADPAELLSRLYEVGVRTLSPWPAPSAAVPTRQSARGDGRRTDMNEQRNEV